MKRFGKKKMQKESQEIPPIEAPSSSPTPQQKEIQDLQEIVNIKTLKENWMLHHLNLMEKIEEHLKGIGIALNNIGELMEDEE